MLVRKKTIRQQLKTEPRSVLRSKSINHCSSTQTEHEVNDFTQTSKTEHMSYMSQEAVLTSMSTLGVQPLIVLQHKPDTTSHKLSTQRIGDMLLILCQNSQFHMIQIVHSKVQNTWCTQIHNIISTILSTQDTGDMIYSYSKHNTLHKLSTKSTEDMMYSHSQHTSHKLSTEETGDMIYLHSLYNNTSHKLSTEDTGNDVPTFTTYHIRQIVHSRCKRHEVLTFTK